MRSVFSTILTDNKVSILSHTSTTIPLYGNRIFSKKGGGMCRIYIDLFSSYKGDSRKPGNMRI